MAPAVSRVARAQTYPTRPVHVIVFFPAGGAGDILARLMGQWLSERLGRPVVIENRAGASENIGTETVVRAAPDGYTLLWATSPNAINATLYQNLNYNFSRDIAPIAATFRCQMSWCSIRHFLPRRFLSLSPTPKHIRPSST